MLARVIILFCWSAAFGINLAESIMEYGAEREGWITYVLLCALDALCAFLAGFNIVIANS